jgi:hypothetical protein
VSTRRGISRQRRSRWLPPNFSDYTVEEGGTGAGTVARYNLKVGNRQRTYRMSVTEPLPESSLRESDTNSSLTTTWTVGRRGSGSRVDVHVEWQGASGVGGFFERLFAPAALKRVYDDALARLDKYMASSSS